MKAFGNRTMWPLFWLLKPEAQALLMQYQWDNFGLKLEIPPRPFASESISFSPSYSMTLEEIDRLMRQKPHPGHPGRIK